MPGIPLFVLTHRAPDTVPAGDPPTPWSQTASSAPSSKPRPPLRDRTWRCWAPASCSSACGAGLLDELIISLVPVVLGRGARPLEGLEPGSVPFDLVRVEVAQSRHAPRPSSAAFPGWYV